MCIYIYIYIYIYIMAVNGLKYLIVNNHVIVMSYIVINRNLIANFICCTCTLNYYVFNTLINMGMEKYGCFMQMYVYY